MPRKKKKDPFVCPKCGTRVNEPVKTWTIVSPIPDKYGRITVTIMASFVCPNCGYKWRDAIKKIKTGGDEAPGREDEKREEGTIIEIDLSDLDEIE
ncbi:MAG: ZPR1-type zinc finger protein [Desulfurococcales archaeon]|nr:ZPR1-type zinc finger protein [Desulfurococcales archaeon]